MGKSAYWLLLKRFQETDEIANLAGIQPELGHARMTGHNSFPKRLLKRLDGVSLVKSPKRRSDGQGAPGDLIDGMAMRTVSLRKRLTGLGVGGGIAWSGDR
jgi:hypothetical protein